MVVKIDVLIFKYEFKRFIQETYKQNIYLNNLTGTLEWEYSTNILHTLFSLTFIFIRFSNWNYSKKWIQLINITQGLLKAFKCIHM